LNILTGVPVGTRELNCGFIRVILILEWCIKPRFIKKIFLVV
jgi:hypothetical protein